MLLSMADACPTDGPQEAFKSYETMAELTGLSKATVRRCADRLVNAGMIERVERRRDDGSQTSNLWRLCMPALYRDRKVRRHLAKGGAHGEHPGAQDEHGGKPDELPDPVLTVSTPRAHGEQPILNPPSESSEKENVPNRSGEAAEKQLLGMINVIGKHAYRWVADSQHRKWLRTILKHSDFAEIELVLRHKHAEWSDARSGGDMLKHFAPDTLGRHWEKYLAQARKADAATKRNRASGQAWRKQIVEPDEPVGEAEDFAEAIREECGTLAKKLRGRATG